MQYGFILLLSVFVCVKLGKCYSLHIVVLVICNKSILFPVNVGSRSCMTVSETGQSKVGLVPIHLVGSLSR